MTTALGVQIWVFGVYPRRLEHCAVGVWVLSPVEHTVFLISRYRPGWIQDASLIQSSVEYYGNTNCTSEPLIFLSKTLPVSDLAAEARRKHWMSRNGS